MKIGPRKLIQVSMVLAILLAVVTGVFFLYGTPLWRRYYLGRCDADIRAAGKRIEVATDDGGRARAYTERARAHSEKARFSMFFKLIDRAEYERQFLLALGDHTRAIMLAPRDADGSFSRGRTYYDRASVEVLVDAGNKTFFPLAEGEFTKAIQLDRTRATFWDWRGLTRLATENLDGAIQDFEQLAHLNPKEGESRLADALCQRGSLHQKGKRPDEAIRDFERSVSASPSRDGCSCDPYEPLAGLYAEKKDYAKGSEIVAKARAAGKGIDPALVEKLKALTPRD